MSPYSTGKHRQLLPLPGQTDQTDPDLRLRIESYTGTSKTPIKKRADGSVIAYKDETNGLIHYEHRTREKPLDIYDPCVEDNDIVFVGFKAHIVRIRYNVSSSSSSSSEGEEDMNEADKNNENSVVNVATSNKAANEQNQPNLSTHSKPTQFKTSPKPTQFKTSPAHGLSLSNKIGPSKTNETNITSIKHEYAPPPPLPPEFRKYVEQQKRLLRNKGIAAAQAAQLELPSPTAATDQTHNQIDPLDLEKIASNAEVVSEGVGFVYVTMFSNDNRDACVGIHEVDIDHEKLRGFVAEDTINGTASVIGLMLLKRVARKFATLPLVFSTVSNTDFSLWSMIRTFGNMIEYKVSVGHFSGAGGEWIRIPPQTDANDNYKRLPTPRDLFVPHGCEYTASVRLDPGYDRDLRMRAQQQEQKQKRLRLATKSAALEPTPVGDFYKSSFKVD